MILLFKLKKHLARGTQTAYNELIRDSFWEFSLLATIDQPSVHDQEAWDKWLASEVQAAIDDPRPGIPHEEVMQRMATRLAQLQVMLEEKIHA